MSNLAYGTFTITNLSAVTSVDVYYYNSTSSTSLSGGSWSTDTPTWANNKYIWSKTVTTWEQGVTTQSEPVCITGQKGSTGATGQSVTKITQQYALSTSSTTAPTTDWFTTMPAFESGKFYWTRSEIVWANPTSTTYTTAVLANGITSANTTADVANTNAQSAVTTANSANTKADNAVSTANTANQTAQNAVSIANGKNTIYYSSSKPTGGTYKAGDTWFFLTEDGYRIYEYDTTAKDWVQKSMDGKSITAGTITAAQIQAGAIVTNKIDANAITTEKLATDAIKSTNYEAGTAPYSNQGTFLDLTNGNIYSPNFGVNNDGTDNITDGAYIKGSIYAYNGTIGQSNTNYWYIGNYRGYDQQPSAYIKGNGTATIQLGSGNTWRLNTNRIHTAWNDDSNSGNAYRLHYPIFEDKYWDMGVHVPTSKADKFLYIRSSNPDNAAISNSNTLENLSNDINDAIGDYWDYQFYVTSEGDLYAKNLYILDDNGGSTQIAGTSAPYLLKSGGDITGNLTIGGTLKISNSILNSSGNDITLQTNLASTAAATLTGNSTSPISIGITGTLPTSNGGTGNTSYTAGGVVYADGSSPKKLLSTAAGTSGYLLKSGGTGAPTWVDPGTLTVAAATKATQDEDGNIIKTTYLKLTGGNITGPVSFGDSVAIDDLNTGTLIVTGNASFTNNIQANTINNVEVGQNPKFTDTVTTITTEGSGNAITAIEATNGTLKAIKGSTFLMGITSQNVTNALGYTPYNATNPNGYTTNTGTVTRVAASGSNGITISGSPITESGTITVGLNLSTAINELGEGTSPANRNDYAVVQYAGGGTTTTTYHRRKLSNIFKALNADDIPSLAWSKITSGNDDLKAIEDLEGTSGLLKKTAANTWELDTNSYVTSSGVTSITLTQGTGISIGSSGTAITSTGTRTISLADNYGDTKNPYASKTARYVLAAPAAAAGLPSFRALTKEDVGLDNVLNIKQVTGIGQGDNGKIRVFKGSGTNDYEDVAVEIVATSTSSVASAQKLSSYGGNATQPIYIPADGENAGKPVAISYTIEKSVPSNAVFTDTWNKVSTSQDGYVTKLPGNITTFLRGDGTWGIPDGTYSLPLAANGTRGGIQVGYSSSGKNYAVQLDSEKAYVNVPWTDTKYSAGTGLSLNGTVFSNAGVIGVKGEKEEGYRTGQVDLTPANLGAVKGNSYFFYGTCDTGAATVIKEVECPDFTANDLKPGAMVCVIFDETNSGAVASLKLDVNNTGAKPIKYIYNGGYSNIPDENYIKLNQVYHFTYDGTNWVIQLNYNTNTNTLGYQLRTNSSSLPVTDPTSRYRLLFTSADNTHFVPANTSTSTNATTERDVNQTKINPFGRIVYYNATTVLAAEGRPGATTLMDQMTITLGYTFNITGAALTLTAWEPVYIKCEPQSDGSAIIYSLEPYVQSLPETDDGFIYIFLGIAYNATAIELMMHHPIYWFKNGKLQPYIQNAQTVNGHSVNKDVPSDAIFTDTWKPLSISQAGYVAQAPNSTSQFLRGDATWASVTAANVGLGNVENTKLSTWAGSSNLTTTAVGTLAVAATKGVVTTLDTSGNLPTAGAVSTAISNSITTALNDYVTLATAQTVSGRKTFNDLAVTTFKGSSGSEYCNINYDQTLSALVFSFG